jgi:hypothetical protein
MNVCYALDLYNALVSGEKKTKMDLTPNIQRT